MGNADIDPLTAVESYAMLIEHSPRIAHFTLIYTCLDYLLFICIIYILSTEIYIIEA